MPGFAVAQAREGQFRDPDGPGAWDASPTSFLGSAQAAWEDGLKTRNTGTRAQQYRDMLWTRHRAIEAATGQKLSPSDAMVDSAHGERLPGVLIDSEYEAQIAALRAKSPDAMSKIETREQMSARLNTRLNAIRAEADKGFRDNPVGAFIGGAGAALVDPFNLSVSLATGGAGAGRGLAGRILGQVIAGAGAEAVAIPQRMTDATLAGPAYGLDEAGLDILTAGIAGGVFQGGGELLGYGVRRAFAGSAAPAARYSAEALDRAVRDDLTLGPQVAGAEHEEGLDALARGAPRPSPPPGQELGELFAGGGTATPQGQAVEYYGRRIEQTTFDPREVGTDAATFQYKADGDAQGVTARLKGVDVWDPTSSGKVIVYERADGSRVIADGHQRRGLALRMDEKGWDARLDGYLFREADGWTARQVRTIAALKNIREGSGTILDAAKVFRDAPEALADRSLPVTGDFISQARALARLSPEAFGAVVNKVIPERYAAEIGAMAAARPDLHPALVKLLSDGQPSNVEEARALVSEAMLDDWVAREGEQADFFGDLPPESTTIARAKVKAAVAAALRKDARVYGQLVKHADAIEAGGNVLLRDANEIAATINRTALEVINRLALRSGDVGEAMADAARQVLDGRRPSEAAKGILSMVRNRLKAGEALEGVRAETIDPAPPSAAAEQLLEGVDDPKTWEAQAREAPEDVGQDPPGLFDDLGELGDAERAHARLLQCAPAKVEAAE